MASSDVSRYPAVDAERPRPIAEDWDGCGLAAAAPIARRVTVGAVVGVVLGCGTLCLAAQVRIPVPGTDVPMTLQHLAVLLVGLSLPARRAVAATVLYLACGAVGLGVFANPAGLTGSTGGFLIGFVVAAWLVSRISGDTRSFRRLLVAAFAGTLAIFVLGVLWRVGLAAVVGGFGTHLAQAVATGVVPFVGKSMVTVALAVTAAWSWRNERLIPRRRSHRPADQV